MLVLPHKWNHVKGAVLCNSSVSQHHAFGIYSRRLSVISGLFLPDAERCSFGHVLGIQPSVGGRLVGLHVLAAVNGAVVSVGVWDSVWTQAFDFLATVVDLLVKFGL